MENKLKEFGEKLSALEEEWARIKLDTDAAMKKMRFEFDQAYERLVDAATEGEQKTDNLASGKKRPQITEQTGNFPYAVGKIVQVAFPILFKQKLITAGDVAYLMSPRAAKDFKIKGTFKVLKPFLGEDDPDLYRQGVCRYYKAIRLELGSKRYCLTNQFRPNARADVLKWITAHGIKRQDLLELMKSET